MKNIDTVVFDIGWVLIDIDAAGEKFSALMRSLDIRPESAFTKFWYVPEVRQHMTGELDSHSFFRLIRDHFGLDISFADFVAGWCDLFHPKPGMEEMFHRVAGNRRVGLLSDTDPLHWAAARNAFPWLAEVEKPTLSFEVGYLKPHPEMYRAAAANCGTAAEKCLFIDDLMANVDGARHYGMPAIHFTTAKKLAHDLRAAGIL